jgi:hypothetical protein
VKLKKTIDEEIQEFLISEEKNKEESEVLQNEFVSRRNFTKSWWQRQQYIATNRACKERIAKISRSWRIIREARIVLKTPPVESGFDPVYDTILFEESQEIVIMRPEILKHDVLEMKKLLDAHILKTLGKPSPCVEGSKKREKMNTVKMNQFIEVEEQEDKLLVELRSKRGSITFPKRLTANESSMRSLPQCQLLGGMSRRQWKKLKNKKFEDTNSSNMFREFPKNSTEKDFSVKAKEIPTMMNEFSSFTGKQESIKDAKLVRDSHFTAQLLKTFHHAFQPNGTSSVVTMICPYQDTKRLMDRDEKIKSMWTPHTSGWLSKYRIFVQAPKNVKKEKFSFHWEIQYHDGDQVRAVTYPEVVAKRLYRNDETQSTWEIPMEPSFMSDDMPLITFYGGKPTYPSVFLFAEGEYMGYLIKNELLHFHAYAYLVYDFDRNYDLGDEDRMSWCRLPSKQPLSLIPETILCIGKEEEKLMDHVKDKRKWLPSPVVIEGTIIKKCSNCDGMYEFEYNEQKFKLIIDLFCSRCLCFLEHEIRRPHVFKDTVRCNTCENYVPTLYGKKKQCGKCVNNALAQYRKQQEPNCTGCGVTFEFVEVDETDLNSLKPLCTHCSKIFELKLFNSTCLYCGCQLKCNGLTGVCETCDAYLRTVLIIRGDRVTMCYVCEAPSKHNYQDCLYCDRCWRSKLVNLWLH